MIRLNSLLLGLLIAIGFVLQGRAQPAPVPSPTIGASARIIVEDLLPKGARLVENLAYVTNGHERQKLDLYLPALAPKAPLLVWVHGGAWRGGSKARPPALSFLGEGYAVASINYRLSQHAVYPAQIEDCKAAIRWLKANAAHYGYDPNRIGVWGSSAGGHLAVLLGTTGDVAEFDQGANLDQTSRVQAVCDFFGPTDVTLMSRFPSTMDHDAPDSPESQLLGGPVQSNKEKAARANPITYVTRDDPPFLIMHGDKDPLVPINQSEILADALRKAGVEVTYKVVEGAGHGFSGPEITARVREFFAKHLRPTPPPQTGVVTPFFEPPALDQNRFAPTANLLKAMWSANRAEGKGLVRLKNFPLRVEDTEKIIPLGLTASGHVTPSDHLYFVPKETGDPARKLEVLAVADGHIVSIQSRPQHNILDPTVFKRDVDLKIIIEHSESVWSYLDHMGNLEESLLKQIGREIAPGMPIQVRIPVKAGQVISRIGKQTFDFALVDTEVTRTGFIRPGHFIHRDPWKLHTVDPFDYVAEPLKSQLLALNPRKVAPFGGRMDYDVDGKLIGNWYREGTGEYAGLNRRVDYWVGHLSFVPHHVRPTNLVVSIGDYAGRPKQFWVKGNGPDPASISTSTGLVKPKSARKSACKKIRSNKMAVGPVQRSLR